MVVIAVANQKGGVGKTTITRELSACCALRGYQVLSVDCDPQGNLTQSWVKSDLYEGTLAHVLIEPEAQPGQRREPLSLFDTIVETPVKNLDLVPCDIRLARFEQQPEYLMHRLKKQLLEHAHGYDLVFIDCPPQLGKLLTAALYSAHFVLIPCAADAMGLQGLADLSHTIEQVRSNVNADLKTLGVVVNLYKPTRNLSAESRAAIEDVLPMVNYVFDTNIHDYAKIAEAPSQQLPVVLYSEEHRSADLFWGFTDEILDRLKLSRQKLSAVR
ncbi:MAG: ParA family protein [Blastocatellia bacterium]|nr:ParA family protein [Blastocatellia bacterium]